jgi:DNA-binding PadR family transcriptional regulator
VDAARLSPTAYVVLGLVSVRLRGGHELAGYAERWIANFCPLTRSHVYSELERLCRMGLLEPTEVRQLRFPTKRVYEVTPEGEAVLGRWLEEASVGPDRQRNLFLVRLFFADRMSPARLDAIRGEYEAEARARRDSLGEVVERLADRMHGGWRATATFGVRREQAKRDWVTEVRPLLLAAASSGLARGGEEC